MHACILIVALRGIGRVFYGFVEIPLKIICPKYSYNAIMITCIIIIIIHQSHNMYVSLALHCRGQLDKKEQ